MAFHFNREKSSWPFHWVDLLWLMRVIFLCQQDVVDMNFMDYHQNGLKYIAGIDEDFNVPLVAFHKKSFDRREKHYDEKTHVKGQWKKNSIRCGSVLRMRCHHSILFFINWVGFH
jgi:hypothetical protein